MEATPQREVEIEASPAPASAPSQDRVWDLRRGVRWFAAEFLVVVSGVVVALSVQSFYQERADARDAQVYLEQVLSDLDKTEETLVNSLSSDSTYAEANRSLMAGTESDAVPLDSVLRWLGGGVSGGLSFYSDPRPVLGTIDALIATGDIRLIADPRLRTGIMSYSSEMAIDLQELSRYTDAILAANNTERLAKERHDVPSRLRIRVDSGAVSPAQVSELWRTMRRDPEVRAAYRMRLNGLNNRVHYLEVMLEQTRQVRAAVPKNGAS